MIHPARYQSLGQILADAFETYPSEIAAIEVDRDRETARLRYADVAQAARRLAGRFAADGLGPDSRIAIAMGNGCTWLIAATAAFWRGAIVVPLDAKLSPAEISALLTHVKADALVTDPHIAHALPERPTRLYLRHATERDLSDGAVAIGPQGCEAPEVEPLPRTREDLATIVYSSGTGGAPKGCCLSHGAYLSQYGALMELFTWDRGDRYLSILPTNHAIDFMCGYLAAWCTGACVIHPQTIRPQILMDTMARYRPTVMAVVPLVLTAFERAIRQKLDALPPPRKRAVDAILHVHGRWMDRTSDPRVARWLLRPIHEAFGGRLHTIFCGGAYTEPRLARFFHTLGLPVAVGYGLTEAGTVLTVNDLRPFRDDTVGKPVPGVQIAVEQPDHEGIGEVLARGPTLFQGYLDNPELTAETLDAQGWLHTGDLGWIDAAGHLHLVGRRRNMIVTPGGKNVYPEDVEARLGTLPVEALCLFAEGYLWPQTQVIGHERIIAVLACGQADPTEVREALRRLVQRLPEHQRVRGLLFVDTPMPRTTSLKLKRAALANQLRERFDPSQVEALF